MLQIQHCGGTDTHEYHSDALIALQTYVHSFAGASSMVNETKTISSWSGKERPNKKQSFKTQNSPEADQAENFRPASEEVNTIIKGCPAALVPPTPRIMMTPKADPSPERSDISSICSDGGSMKSADTQTQRRPSSSSIYREQSQGGSTDEGSATHKIRTIDLLL